MISKGFIRKIIVIEKLSFFQFSEECLIIDPLKTIVKSYDIVNLILFLVFIFPLDCSSEAVNLECNFNADFGYATDSYVYRCEEQS